MGVYDGERPILFREWVEGLVRVAHAKFVLVGAENIGNAVKNLMDDHIRLYATQTGLNPFEEKLREPKVKAIFEKHSSLVGDIFKLYAGESVSLSLKNLYAMCADCSNFGSCKLLSVDEVKLIVGETVDSNSNGHGHSHGRGRTHSSSKSMIVQSSSKIGDGSIVYEEFEEALVRLANLYVGEQKPLTEKLNRLVDNVLQPLMAEVEAEKKKKKGGGEHTETQKQEKKVVIVVDGGDGGDEGGGGGGEKKEEDKEESKEEKNMVEEKKVEEIVEKVKKMELNATKTRSAGRRPPRR